MTSVNTNKAPLETTTLRAAAHEAARLQPLSFRDRELIAAVRAHHPTLSEAGLLS
jgi:hypothetical protein